MIQKKLLLGLRNIHFRRPGQPTGINFSLDVYEGEFVLIEGPNGIGKSYLLNLMAALRKPNNGDVILGDKNLMRMSKADCRSWRRRLGLIPAKTVLLDGYSVGENLRFTAQLLGVSAEDSEEYAQATARLCGLTQVWDAPVESLSEGTRHRVGIARALVSKPTLILADNPLQSLDVKAQEQFLYLCVKLVQLGYSVVMTSGAPLPFEIGCVKRYCLGTAS